MTGCPTLRVRYRAEWVEELPADTDFKEGDRVRCGHRELTVLGVGDPAFQKRLTPEGPIPPDLRWRRKASDGELRGADLIVELAPSLFVRGSTWRAECLLCRWGRISPQGHMGYPDWEEPVFEAADLGDVLDSIADWAERMRWVIGGGAHGWAKLRTVEPGESPSRDGRILVWAELPEGGVVDALEAFCEEAERRYGVEPT